MVGVRTVGWIRRSGDPACAGPADPPRLGRRPGQPRPSRRLDGSLPAVGAWSTRRVTRVGADHDSPRADQRIRHPESPAFRLVGRRRETTGRTAASVPARRRVDRSANAVRQGTRHTRGSGARGPGPGRAPGPNTQHTKLRAATNVSARDFWVRFSCIRRGAG